MGYRKDDCQYDCWWGWWEKLGSDRNKSWKEIQATDPDPNDPAFQMCMNACDTVDWGSANGDSMVGVVQWKAIKRSLAEGVPFTGFAKFTRGDDEFVDF